MLCILVVTLVIFIFKPARPWCPGFNHPLLGTGSTPNLTAGSYSLPPRTLTSMPLGEDSARLGFNTIAHSTGGSRCSDNLQQLDTFTFGSAMNLPRDGSFGTYSSYQPPAPPLGYIVAYTPEQLTEIIKDQYQFGPPSSMYQCPVSHYSPGASPKKTASARHSLLVSNGYGFVVDLFWCLKCSTVMC